MPITLYNIIFGEFQDDCKAYEPMKEDHDFAFKFSLSMSKFYLSEKERMQEARDQLEDYGLQFLPTEIHGYKTDGDMRCGKFCIGILEGKPELCMGNAEPLFEAAWYYVAFTRHHLQANLGSHLPCFILYLAGKCACISCHCSVSYSNVCTTGAHIGFAGAIWTDRPHFQVLAPMLPLFYHATDNNFRMRAARYFGATKKAILALKAYYESELPRLSMAPTQRSPASPYPSEYECLDATEDTTRTFEFVSPVDEDKLIFYGTAGHEKLCIKFVHRYSPEAHLKCADMGFAPALRGFQPIPGGWYMVVMDCLDRGEYCDFADSPNQESFETEIREKVGRLHQASFVHGDIRSSNIMVKKDSSPGIKLVDFDWAGIIGEVRYPANVNMEIRRPSGVGDNELIMAEHDIQMIDFMFETRLQEK